VHFVIDNVRADRLRDEWTRANRGVVLDFIDCPDRRLTHCAAELVGREVEDPSTHVTVILPRRSYSALLGRLLHDRTADKIAAVVSRIPRSAATIIPYDVQSRVRMVQERQAARAVQADGQPPSPDGSPAPAGAGSAPGNQGTGQSAPSGRAEPAAAGPSPAANPSPAGRQTSPDQEMSDVRKLRDLVKGRDQSESPPAAEGGVAAYGRPVPPADVTPIGSITAPGKSTVEGRVRALEIRPVEQNSVLALEISDSTGDLTALFYGRSHIAGVICGSLVRLRGPVGIKDGHPVMINPAYELVASGAGQ
jgi:hypothetical protein